MKKITFMACAALLTSMIALNSCKSDEPGGNPNLNDGDVVKTEFVINLPEASNGPLKMPGTTVPENGVFKGMKNIAIIPFAAPGEISSTDVRLGNGRLAGIGDIPAAGDGTLTNKGAKLYSDISIPLTTSSFLVYAEATNAAADGGTDDAKHQNGVLVVTDTAMNATHTPADIHFDLQKVLGATTLDALYTDAKAAGLLALLNAVANASDGTKAWKAYTSGDDAGMVAIWETYKTMHALSSFEVERVLKDLYTAVEPLKGATPATKVSTLAAAIQTAIETGVDVTRDGENKVTAFALKTTPTDLTGYPQNHNLPQGSIRIKYSTDAFVACVEGDYGSSTQTNPTLFVYPTSLWYYANSTIKTANKSMASYYVDGKYWKEILAAYTTEDKPAVVSTETRSVAIVDSIQYAVGRLDVSVKLDAGTLKDKAEQDITADAAGFPVTAVFIGNQRQVKFDFTPTDAASPTLYTIYDNALTGINADTEDFSTVNSTLVLETPATTAAADATDDNADVQIAIELTNNAADFIGANGQLIPKNGKFYLVAKLKASAATEDNAGKRVFRQDVRTIAKFTIKNLKNAYNEIPDLRTPKLELGMSVDLSWKAGHTYEIDL